MKRKYLYAILLSASLVGSASPLQGQNKAYNYVHSTVMLDKEGVNHLETVQYYNAFGSSVRNVKYGFTPIGKDLLTHEDRDVLNRPHHNWLPLPSERKDELMPDYDYARLAKEFYNDTNPYVRTVYENSPLARVREQYGEGALWQNAGKGVKTKYLSNTKNGTLDCRRYVLKDNGGDSFTLTHSGVYAAATLQVKETTNEDGNKSYEFTDTQGRLLLSRQMDGDTPHDTYFLYTLSGEAQAVLPPALTDQATIIKTYGMEEIRKYAYLYRYDRRDRLTEKWIPGSTSSVRNVYDQADRPVLTQDANLRRKNQWSLTKYDVHGRSILTGILTTSTSFEALTESIGNLAATESYTGNRATDSYGYTQNLNPGNISILSVTYYDDYHFLELDTDFVPYTQDAVSGEYYASPKGKVTGEIIFALEDTARAKHITHYYDNRSFEIQSNTHDSQGFTDRNYTKYDFTGHPLNVKHTHTGTGNASLQELYTYTYDHGQRLTQVKHKLNNEPEVILTANEYDEVCRLKRTTMNNAQLVTEFDYNIRNWITKINNPKFTQALHYTDGLSTPCYNGNISSMTWRDNDLTERGYKFTYDGLSRLKDALYGEGNNLTTNPDRFNEQVTGYDKQGNILSLKRSGQTASNAYGLIDNLSLSYDGNQLKAVNDNAINSAYGDGFEFKDGAKQAVEYNYDSNGNLTRDLNKKITDIQYNCLNLPRRIQFADGNSISYLYGADGTKFRTTHVIDGVTTTTDYCGNAIYENGVLTKLLTEQGYITLADKIYHYFIQDHQGNNRVVVNQNGAAEETNQYYPFGGMFASSSSVQPYKYNGKELDRKGGLDWCDYGARHYDAAIGRWHTIDLMAEKYYNSSPFVYCANNPIRFIDPTGLAWRQTYDEDHDGFQMPSGYAWVDEAESYNDDGTLKKGLYAQAIFFSDNGIFNVASNKNMGSSTATVYLADGTMNTFDANTLPSSEDFATVPEGVYHATVGSHKGQYTALRMSDTDKKGRIELGTSNPAHPERTYAEGINIHKPGQDNLTGMTRSGKPISAGCLLIDRNNWSSFIKLFDNDSQRKSTVSVTVSRSIATPVNATRLPAFNFILNGSRSKFFKR